MSKRAQETVGESQSGDEYVIRWYQPGDADDVLSLFETELDRVRSREYFEWKYVDDPYLSHVPVNVAERDGELVGVQVYVPCPLRDGDRTVLALQPADAVVHSDHRRNGLYTRMTEQAIDRYTGGEPALFFNYPSPGALGAQQKLGWESLGDLDVYYRVQRPSAFLGDVTDGVAGRALGRSADALARGAYGAIDRFAPSMADVSVTRRDDVPAATLASLYERHVPDGLHVHRERQFYEWWLAHPAFEYTTYVARSDGEPVAALVTRTHPSGVLQLRDAVPLEPTRRGRRLGRLLSTALADNPDVTTVKSVGSTLPTELLRRFGFVGDSAPVLDDRTKPLTMAVRPLSDDGDGAPGAAVTDRSNWQPTFVEIDRD